MAPRTSQHAQRAKAVTPVQPDRGDLRCLVTSLRGAVKTLHALTSLAREVVGNRDDVYLVAEGSEGQLRTVLGCLERRLRVAAPDLEKTTRGTASQQGKARDTSRSAAERSSMDVDGVAKPSRSARRRAQAAARKAAANAMDVPKLPSSEASVVVAPEALALLAMKNRQDDNDDDDIDVGNVLEDDSWADGVTRPTGSGRKLEVRRSGSRTPPLQKGKARGSTTSVAVKFSIGDPVRISSMDSRPDLVGASVTVMGFDDTGGRYTVMLGNGDLVMVPSASLMYLTKG